MRAALLATAAVAILLAGCSATTTQTTGNSSSTSSSHSSEANHVGLYDNYFEDGNRTVAIGTMLTFENEGSHSHTVTIHHPPDPLNVTLADMTLGPGETYTFTFALPGTYHVWCRFHGQMTAGMHAVVMVA